MAELHDRGDQPDPGDDPERERPDRPRPISDGREIDFDDPKWHATDFDLSGDQRAELDSTSRMPHVERPADGEPDAEGRENAEPIAEHRGDESGHDEPEQPDEQRLETVRPPVDGDIVDSSKQPADPPGIAADSAPVESPERFGELFADHQHEPFDMDRHDGVAAYRADGGDPPPQAGGPPARDFDPATHREDRPLDAGEPRIGDLIAEGDHDEASRFEKIRRKGLETTEDLADRLGKVAHNTQDFFDRPPAGHAEVRTPQAVPMQAPHHGIDAGDVTTAGFVVAVILAETGRRLMAHWRQFRKGHDHAGER